MDSLSTYFPTLSQALHFISSQKTSGTRCFLIVQDRNDGSFQTYTYQGGDVHVPSYQEVVGYFRLPDYH